MDIIIEIVLHIGLGLESVIVIFELFANFVSCCVWLSSCAFTASHFVDTIINDFTFADTGVKELELGVFANVVGHFGILFFYFIANFHNFIKILKRK